MSEEQEHAQLAEYLKLQYPKLIFNSDMSGVRLTPGLAKKVSKLRSKDHKFPDIVLYHRNSQYQGLFIELKKTGEKLYKKDGSYKSEHLEVQSATLLALHDQGYCAVFAIGFNQAKEIIDDYMKIK